MERERVRGAITTRCSRVIGPIFSGVKSFRSVSAVIVLSLFSSCEALMLVAGHLQPAGIGCDGLLSRTMKEASQIFLLRRNKFSRTPSGGMPDNTIEGKLARCLG